MRRRFLFFIHIMIAASLTACSARAASETEKAALPSEAVPQADAVQSEITRQKASNVLIAYFSEPENVDTAGVDAVAGASVVVKEGEILGNTEYAAKLIQDAVGGDLFRIETTAEYPSDHEPLVDQAAEEQEENLRPELASHVENFSQYEYVFLGYPNWWGDMPQALYTFLEEYDFGAKTIIPFITHGGSGVSRTVETISQLQPGALMSENALVLSRNHVAGSKEEVMAWAEGLGIHTQATLPENADGSTVLTAAADAKKGRICICGRKEICLW